MSAFGSQLVCWLTGLDDLNHIDLNHQFKLQYRSNDFLKKSLI